MKKGMKHNVFKNTYLLAIKISTIFWQHQMPLHNSVADVVESNSGFCRNPTSDYRKQTCGKAFGAGFQQLGRCGGTASVSQLRAVTAGYNKSLWEQELTTSLRARTSLQGCIVVKMIKLNLRFYLGRCSAAVCFLSCSSTVNSSVWLKCYSTGPVSLVSKLTVKCFRAQLQVTIVESLIPS